MKRRLSSYLLSTIRKHKVSFAYLRLLILLPEILIPACASSSLAFPMMYSVYKLNKQGDNIQPWCTPFPIWNKSVFSIFDCNCCFLTCIQVSQEPSKVVWYSHLFKNFPQFVVIYAVKGFSVVNEADIDVLFCFVLCNSLAFSMIQQILAVWCLVPLPFLNPAW